MPGDKTPKVSPSKLFAENEAEEYREVVEPYYRDQAAQTVQSAVKRWKKVKSSKADLETAMAQTPPPVNVAELRKRYHEAKSQPIKAMSRLEEPAFVVEEDKFILKLTEAIGNNDYREIDYADKHFTQRLFAALRLGIITTNQMMTAKLMYESLICFNKGKLPENLGQFFQRFEFNSFGPYEPFYISHWNDAESMQFELELARRKSVEAYHYYTIDLARHQAIGFLYYGIDRGIKKDHFTRLLDEYIYKLELRRDEKKSIRALITAYKDSPNDSQDEYKQRLKDFILKQEPTLENFLQRRYDSLNEEQTLGLTYEEFKVEINSVLFLVSLYAVDCQIPCLCISPSGEESLLSFVLPTIDSLNMLQKIAHGEEATFPQPVIGQLTPRMIRAFDEVPACKGKELSRSQELLKALHPNAVKLKAPSRPIELTYPGVEKTANPHGADCHDFLLSWHDLFHAWRNGSNYKEFIRQLRQLHDEKLGFAVRVDAMSKVLWELTDVDFSVGQVFRENSSTTVLNEYMMAAILKKAGIDFTQPSDDNYLFLYSVCQSAEAWGKPFSIDLANLHSAHDRGEQFNQMCYKLADMKKYMAAHPRATVVEVILHDLLKPGEKEDEILLNVLDKAKLTTIFYWSKNSGLYFKDEFREQLNWLGINPQLRNNSPSMLRKALQSIAITVANEEYISQLAQAGEAAAIEEAPADAATIQEQCEDQSENILRP
ncbi:MAG: hypothetical protein EBY16_06770 [Gammaproteobacteria bacterium]|nr:hypothetical protein [Gammaproteobacteria bacterium]